MKSLFVLVIAMVMGMGICSCGTSKGSWQNIAGDWDVISLNGKPVTVSDVRHPYMGLNLKEGIMSGSTGCNRMMGAVTVDKKHRTISFGPVSGTRMACPDMSLEQGIFMALEKVQRYQFLPDGSLVLQDEKGGELMTLKIR